MIAYFAYFRLSFIVSTLLSVLAYISIDFPFFLFLVFYNLSYPSHSFNLQFSWNEYSG